MCACCLCVCVCVAYRAIEELHQEVVWEEQAMGVEEETRAGAATEPQRESEGGPSIEVVHCMFNKLHSQSDWL